MLFRRLVFLCAFMAVVHPLSAESPKSQFLKSQLVFEPNQGQAASSVRFLSRSNGHSFLLKDTEAVLAFADPAVSVHMRLIGQNSRPAIEGIDLQPGVTNYFHGSNPKRWLTAVPNFSKVKYGGVYPGIDLIYYGNQRQLEYDFEIQPLRDPSTIQISFEGVEKLAVGSDGDLILTTTAGEIRHQRPIAFQRRGEVEVPVEASFVVRGDRVGFQVGRYDRTLPLTIDPRLVWSSYIGATGEDQGNDVAVDGDGNVYLVGFTQTVEVMPPADESTPPPNPTLITPIDQGFESFVTKIDPTGVIVYTTYYGGRGVDEGHSLVLDATGSLYAVGYTTSVDFPIVGGFQTKLNGIQDATIVKLATSSGGIQFSSYLGGANSDRAYGVALDGAGNAYVAGGTLSASFPILNAFQSKYGGGLRDGFLTKITTAGTIGFSTFLGGNGDEQIYDVGVDVDGEIVVTGYTSSQNFPTSNPLYRGYRGGTDDVFISKFNSAGNALVFSTYFGGSGADSGVRLTLDAEKNIYVTGTTASPDFPLKRPAQLFHGGAYDAFLIKLHPDGKDADFSTFIGGEDTEGGTAVALDPNGFIYVSGFTNSVGFYAINAIGGFLRGARDGFVIKMAPDASVLVYSTYLGDFGTEAATSIAVDTAGNAYVTGFTTSSFFPVASNAFQTTLAGGQDGFIVKISSDDVKTNEPFAFPANGGASTATAGQTARPMFGYVAADVAAGLSPTGLEIVDLRSQGTLVNEVSVPAPQLEGVGRLAVSTAQASATALTIVNPNDSEATIDYYFTAKGGGGTNLFGSYKLPAHSQSSSFLYAQPYNLPTDLNGTVSFTSDVPVYAIALLVGGSGASPTNVYIPIINPYKANDRPVTVPQFVDGGGWTTETYLVNPTEDTITGEIRLFQSAGPDQPGVPLEVSTEQGLGSVFSYTIEPRSLFTLVGRGETGDTRSGFAEIVPTPGSFAPLAHATVSSTNVGFLSTTVEAVEPAKASKMYVEISGKFPEALAAMPALALANSSDTPATVTLKLFGLDGSDTGLSGVITLPPKGHYPRFLYDVPGFENLPSPFKGVLQVTTSQSGVSFAGFRSRYNEQTQFLITATGPLKDLVNLNPIVFPHLVDGGGYATQFVVISGSGGAAGTIRYLDPSGNPLNVAISPE